MRDSPAALMTTQVVRPSLPGGLLGYLAMERSPSAIAELDGLRAIAILLVLARHAVQRFHEGTQPLLPIAGWDAAAPLLNGWIGVDLFFVLSGFLIGKHLLACYRDPNGLALAPYLARRALRIVPAYFAVLLIVAAGLVPMFAVREDALGLRVAYHMLFLQDYLTPNIVGVFWSLGVEEKFYLFAPLILAAVLRWRRPQAQLAVALAIALLGPALRLVSAFTHPGIDTYGPTYFYTFRTPFHACIDALMLGVLIALVQHHRAHLPWLGRPALARLALWPALGLSGWLLLPTPLLAGVGLFDKVLQPLLIALGAAGALYGLVLSGRPAPILRGLSLLVLARLSYCLYLVHMPLIPGLIWLVDGPLALADAPQVLRFAAFLPLFAIASLLAAACLHYLVEKPFLLLKDRI
jgi:peptidoglycan/LPS O-acetylase OafA/YrhL